MQVKRFGNHQDGIEIRSDKDGIDEIFLYRDGEVCVHIEAMNDDCYWMSLQSRKWEVHANCFLSEKGVVEMNAHGWNKETGR